MERTFEATIEKRDGWYIGWVDAVPEAFSQGRTIKEIQENLVEAVQLILESQEELRAKGAAENIRRVCSLLSGRRREPRFPARGLGVSPRFLSTFPLSFPGRGGQACHEPAEWG